MAESANTEPTAVDPSPEEASDSQLRVWARDNGIEGVPASGKLSASWREKIVNAMTAALDPKDEASVEATTTPTSSSPETVTEKTTTETGTTPAGESTSPPTETVASKAEWKSEDEPVAEYRSVFQPPNTFVSSQAFTS